MGRLTSGLAFAFRTFLLRQMRPYLFGLVVTDRCNLDCFYCESKNSDRFHLPAEQAVAMLEEAYARGHRSLYFTGGEPMLWSDGGLRLQDLVAEARRLGFCDVFVFTNGTFPLGIRDCNYIVTLDGPRAVHDRIRGGTYDAILAKPTCAAPARRRSSPRSPSARPTSAISRSSCARSRPPTCSEVSRSTS
jgi:Fe-coproporphyrin III synthase